MATYKVLQDIEAEDKLIGPLTLRQCIYAAIAILAGYLSFLAITKGAAFLTVFFLPFMIFGGFFAFPWSRQQPTEIWALAKISFALKPRKRIWNQSGVKELVTITVPKKLEHIYSNGLSETEVTSRLRALADTIDTRGWAVKNVDVQSYSRANNPDLTTSDRLVDASAFPREVPTLDDAGAPDMLDPFSSPVARQFDSLISASSQARRQKITDDINQSILPAPVSTPSSQSSQAPPADYWFMNQPDGAGTAHAGLALVTPGASPTSPSAAGPVAATPTDDEVALTKSLKAGGSNRYTKPFTHLRTINPLSNPSRNTTVQQTAQPSVTTQPTPATLGGVNNDDLVRNNDLSVATIAREAQRRNPEPPDEVTVSLR